METPVEPTGLAPACQGDYQRRPSMTSMFSMTQPTPDFKTNQPSFSQQPPFNSPNFGFQHQNSVQSGTTIQLNLASYPTAQGTKTTDSMSVPTPNMPNDTESLTPPPPYTPSFHVQSLHLNQPRSEMRQAPHSTSVAQPPLPSQPLSTPSIRTATKLTETNTQNVTGIPATLSPQPTAVPHLASVSELTHEVPSPRLPLCGMTVPVIDKQPNIPQVQSASVRLMNQQQMQPQSMQSLPIQPQALIPEPMQTSMPPLPSQVPPTPVQTPQFIQPQPMQTSASAYPSQQWHNNPVAPPSPLPQSMASNAIPAYQQQFSQMSLSPFPNSTSPILQQGQIQVQEQPQQRLPQFNPQLSPNFNTNAQAYGQNTQVQYCPQPNHPFQQYPTSPSLPGSQTQQFPTQQNAGFLSVGIGVPTGVFGGRNGNMGSAMAFAPPPQQQSLGLQKKKSFRTLGGFLK
jgi:hypothetical protein